MPTAGQSIADEIEAAIGGGSTAKCVETARRVTDLFLVSAGQFNGEQIELFDNVLERLVKAIEQHAIADIAARMALADDLDKEFRQTFPHRNVKAYSDMYDHAVAMMKSTSER